MAVSLKHKFVSAKADGDDDSIVRPSNWNDNHDLTLAEDKILGRASADTGPVEEITCTAAGRALLDDADAATQRSTLGLGTAATAASTDFATASHNHDSAYVPLARTVSASGLATGGGDLSANRTITVPKAEAADYRAGTDDAKALTSKSAYDGVAVVTLTDASTIAVDMAAGINFEVTLGGNRMLGNPTNAKPGQAGFIKIYTNGSSRTLSYGTNWKASGGAQAISTTDTTDYLFYQVITSSLIVYTLVTDPTS